MQLIFNFLLKFKSFFDYFCFNFTYFLRLQFNQKLVFINIFKSQLLQIEKINITALAKKSVIKMACCIIKVTVTRLLITIIT